MKVRDTLTTDLIYTTLRDKLMNFIHDRHRYVSDWDATTYVKKNFPKWQYNGVAPFEEVLLWCEKNLGNDWIWNFETFYFKTEQDKLLFALRWS